MSKMSQLHAELEESAAELGFESFEAAERAGYRPDYNNGTLYKPQPIEELLEEAHKSWIEERDMLLSALKEMQRQAEDDGRDGDACVIKDTIEFIKRGEI